MYRLHIDIPLGTDEEKAIDVAERMIQWCFYDDRLQVMKMNQNGVEQINYRLGHDEDRQKSNYLQKNENGHVTNKKTKISI